jgi:hypothetical protein
MGADGYEGVLNLEDKILAEKEWKKFSYSGTYLGSDPPMTVRLRKIEFHDEPVFSSEEDVRKAKTGFGNKWDLIAHAWKFQTPEGNFKWFWSGTTPS